MNILSIKLVSIAHSGAPVGDDIRIEAEALGSFFFIHKKVPNGKNVPIGKEVAQASVDGIASRIPVTLRVIERDPVFNDVGTVEISLPVPAGDRRPKRTIHDVPVYEWRGTMRKKAIFTVEIETSVTLPVRYLGEGKNGWTAVRPEDGKDPFSLAVHIRVALSRRDGEREYFTVMEGRERGRKASVQMQTDGSSALGGKDERQDSVDLIYSISKKTLRHGRQVYATVDYKDAPWTPGRYDIELPDFPHAGGRPYVSEAPHALTWFLVGHGGARYIHIGSRSGGCITLTERTRWEGLYQILVRARKGDGISIGTLEVIA